MAGQSGYSAVFTATVWRAQTAAAAWQFVTVPDDISDEIAEVVENKVKGFGSVRVDVTCGSTTWQTSLFPSKEHSAYILPMKKAVLTAENLTVGDTAEITLTVVI